MFLNEVALGKHHVITRDDPSLTIAPKGCDSVLAKGMTEPDPKEDTHLTIEGKKVIGNMIKTKRIIKRSTLYLTLVYLLFSTSRKASQSKCELVFFTERISRL